MGIGVRDIARIIGTSVPTLRKHCRDELENAAHEAHAAVMNALFRSATGADGSGRVNVRAAKAWLEVRNLFPVAARAVEASAAGKKVARQAAARKVASSGKFAPGQAPRLVVDNTVPPKAASDDDPK